MRILQAFEFMSLPHGGGTVEAVYKLSRALQQRGHEVTLCVSDWELDKDYLKSLDVNLKLFHNWAKIANICFMPDILKLNVRDYDVIHLHCYRSFQNVVLSYKALKHGVPYIIDPHGSNKKFGKSLFKSLYDVVFKRLLDGASKIIAETELDVKDYADKSKVVVLRSIFDINEYDCLPKRGLFRTKYGIKTPIILFMGRINKIKGLEYLVNSFDKLSRAYDAILVIAGQDDGYRTELEAKIKSLGLSDRVLFTGYLKGDDKKSAMVDADMLVQPSINEAGARPSFESILCRTPVIVTKNTGAGNDIRDIDGGILFDYGDIEGMSKAMQYILDNKDDAKIKTLKAKELIRTKLSVEFQVNKYEELYKNTCISRL
jgi:glycosyltransferase involved in cell wall biosynthesis